MGKTLLTQITTFDFICAILLSELVGNALYDDELGVLHIFVTIAVWTLLIWLTEQITQKFRKTRDILEGKPSIIISHGKLSFEELKKGHLDINQFLHLLRTKDIFSMRDVQYAILESNGDLSVLKKPSANSEGKQGSNPARKDFYIAITLISDGELIEENLSEINQDKDWVVRELKKRKLSIPEVLYAEWLEGDGLFIQEY